MRLRQISVWYQQISLPTTLAKRGGGVYISSGSISMDEECSVLGNTATFVLFNGGGYKQGVVLKINIPLFNQQFQIDI
jgi:hypothetical protein